MSGPPDDAAPVPPTRPEPEDCCNGGCARCVFDVYEDALDRYRAELDAWMRRRAAAAPPPS